MNKEELRNVDGSDSLHPNRSGDVVVVTRPPYQSDAGTPDQTIALSHFFGQHGYLPNLVDLDEQHQHARDVRRRAGRASSTSTNVKGLRAVDLAPTLAFLMGIPGPQNARGGILYDLVKDAEDLKELTILDISDWHAQLTPLAEAADNLAVGPPTEFTIGGAAFLQDVVRPLRAPRLRAAGPSSKVLPVMAPGLVRRSDAADLELLRRQADDRRSMNMMGIDIDAHREPQLRPRRAYLRNELIPLATFPIALGQRGLPERLRRRR